MDWTTDISKVSGKIRVYDEDNEMQKAWLENIVELVEDCDIDCQRTGSGMSTVAMLNGLALTFIVINCIFMLCGINMKRCRMLSVYCTFFTCMFQFAIIITTAVYIFSSYT